MISITKGNPDHASLLSQIGGQTIIESHGRSAPAHVMQSYVTDKFSEVAVREELQDPRNLFYLLYHSGALAGYSKIIYDIPVEGIPSRNITKMERLYLLEAFHSLKLGHALMEFNISLARQHGQVGMWVYVWKGNDRAIRFYERAGFGIIGDGFFRLTEEHANPNWQMFLRF